MKNKNVYVVTFRNSDSELTCMFTEKFCSVEGAKEAIEFDGSFFKSAHSFKNLNMSGDKSKQFAHWVKPKSEDYYLVQGEDGARCIYQYFKI